MRGAILSARIVSSLLRQFDINQRLIDFAMRQLARFCQTHIGDHLHSEARVSCTYKRDRL